MTRGSLALTSTSISSQVLSAVILWHLMVIILSLPPFLEAAAPALPPPELQLPLRAAFGVLHGLITDAEVTDGMEVLLFVVLVAELHMHSVSR